MERKDITTVLVMWIVRPRAVHVYAQAQAQDPVRVNIE